MSQKFPIKTAQQLTEYVRALRKSRGQTQADIARLMGVSTMRVATIEKDVGRLSTGRLLALLQLLGARLDLEIDQEVTWPSENRERSPDSLKPTPRSTEGIPKRSQGGEW